MPVPFKFRYVDDRWRPHLALGSVCKSVEPFIFHRSILSQVFLVTVSCDSKMARNALEIPIACGFVLFSHR